jgi:Pyruvate/2-oxoacid:ferredoxin oxidoreductase delta subunit
MGAWAAILDRDENNKEMDYIYQIGCGMGNNGCLRQCSRHNNEDHIF